ILMSEPSPADAELAQAMTENNVVLATTFHNVNGEIQNIGEKIKPDLAPTQKLLDNALTIGHIYQLSDPDGFTRNYRLYLGKNFHMPSLAAATADAYSMTKELIALPPEAQIKINWPSSVDEISNVSLVDILDRKVSLKFFKDKVILVGSTATGIDQKTLTPFDNVVHVGGVYVHAAALNNALEQNWLRQLPIYILFGVWSFVLLAGLTLSMLSIKADKFYASIWATIGFTVSWLILAQLLFINNLLLPITAPIITFWLVTLVHIFRAAFQKSISQRSRTLIEQYLSKEIQALEQNMDASSKQPHTDSQKNASS
ncbi:MAG: CHASE2 domain-containing protein, partial [Bacteroidota bacterium]